MLMKSSYIEIEASMKKGYVIDFKIIIIELSEMDGGFVLCMNKTFQRFLRLMYLKLFFFFTFKIKSSILTGRIM